MTNSVHGKIDAIVKSHSVVLFMKGTPNSPMCGFSARAAGILQDIGVNFYSVNVLEDSEIREGIKTYGNWPTIPQLYIKSELVGGSDIMMEMYQTGELQKMLS